MYKILFTLFIGLITSGLSAQNAVIRNPEIEQLVKEVSADSLKKYIYDLTRFSTRHTLSRDEKNGMPAAQRYVLSKFNSFAKASNGRMSAEIEQFTIPSDGRRITADAPGANVIATLKGTNPADDRIFIISGHLDSRNKDVMDAEGGAPGANDDGSGVAAVIELARVMAKMEFSATILFVAFTGEEQGLKGATYLAEKAVAEGWNIAGVLNNDIIGNSNSSDTHINDNTKMRVFSETIPLAEDERQASIRRYTNADNDSKSRQLARYIKEVGERYVDQMEVKLIYRSDRFLRGGDQTPFLRNGFTAVRMSEMNENFYHQHENVRIENGIQYGDLPEFMDFEYLRKVSAVNLAAAASLANSADMPQEVQIDVRGLSNKSILLWKAPAIGTPKGYYVLMRETSSPVWEKKFFTTETTLTLPYSKDNYFFAVQSVTESGAESLAVFPSPLTR
ncbi:M20/M25/M40 family metallo-hydrolase [Algoriphagus boritolerans]|uniref:Peptidase family M28 n=1 Tax=Algoriphagus boritolerans DSM 17298 = JCM 18970 TaxID=1120964 RepID=A0A1H5TJD2_9BACT|nr:M20/M25/M40 family metallo-hydrolase [Algoriphagus boritolerans]SEF62992.1 Peptidase family M28 [Algoriphagus boritolerans DSM 17298 = JCM 18970]